MSPPLPNPKSQEHNPPNAQTPETLPYPPWTLHLSALPSPGCMTGCLASSTGPSTTSPPTPLPSRTCATQAQRAGIRHRHRHRHSGQASGTGTGTGTVGRHLVQAQARRHSGQASGIRHRHRHRHSGQASGTGTGTGTMGRHQAQAQAQAQAQRAGRHR